MTSSMPEAITANHADCQTPAILLYGFDYLEKQFKILHTLIPRIGQDQDIEIVHDVRVAVRRARTALNILKPDLPKRLFGKGNRVLKTLADSLTSQRDTDVQLAFLSTLIETNPPTSFLPGLRRVRHLLIGRTHEQTQLNIKEQSKYALETIKRMRTWAEIHLKVKNRILDNRFFALAGSHLKKRLNGFLLYEKPAFLLPNEQAAHRMRIAAKKLRYSMEFFEDAYGNKLADGIKTIKEVQQILGELHDCDVWLNYLIQIEKSERIRFVNFFGHEETFPRIQAGILFLRDNREKKRRALFQNFSEKWNDWKEISFWKELENQFNDTDLCP